MYLGEVCPVPSLAILALWLEILGTWESLIVTHFYHISNMGVAVWHHGPIMYTNSPDSINLGASWKRNTGISPPPNPAAQGNILETTPFA